LQEECDRYQCRFDSADCTYNINIYEHCSAIRFGIPCYDLFNNSVCDRACNSAECLFDGWDCQDDFQSCNPMYDAYCLEHYADGFCDTGCNVPECLWDGLDCVSRHHLESGLIVIAVAVPPAEFARVQTRFVRQLAELLHTVVIVARDTDGKEMIEPWDMPDNSDTASRRDRRSVVDGLFRQKRAAGVGLAFFLTF